MPLLAGTRLGPYEVLAPLGAGGMGEVYRARDTRLNRDVALKILPPAFAGDADRLRRFQREAEMASALNHPHILTVHDTGEFEGQHYLVTEYVAGGTLRDWAKAEQRVWREIVELLVGVADGLATAHEANILHRDIKPANILVSKQGYAKLADFGLAKLVEPLAPAIGEDAPTATAATTRPGMIVGTVAYMSPEQASGQPVDVRSDIFAFGVVLYELLSGRRPFAGGSELEELKAIVHGTAAPLPDAIPAALRVVVEKALEKDPADRYQSMREVTVDLRRLARHSGETAASAAPLARRFPWAWAVVPPVLLITAFLAWRFMRTGESTEPLRAVPLTTLRGVQRHPTCSPDGNYVAFSWSGPKQDNPDIYVQQVGAGSPLRLTTDPGNDSDPTWSPDGRWIAFLRSKPAPGKSELRLIPPLGGPERKLAEIAISGMEVIPPHLSWCRDSNCLVATDSQGPGQPDALFVISLETGAKTPLTHPRHPALGDTNPAVSPDGNSLVFSRRAHLFSGEIYLVPLGAGMRAAGEPRRLTPAAMDAIHPAWMPGGTEILFSSKRGLWRLATSGDRQPSRLPFVGEDGIMPVISHVPPLRLIYGRSTFDANIWRIDTSAAGAPASSPPVVAVSSTRSEGMPQLSPDGRRVAFWSDRSGDDEIWVSDLDGSNAIQLTSRGAPATGYPHWSPDGQLIAFHSSPEGKGDVYVVPAAGGKPRNLTNHPPKEAFPSFSRDGKWIYFTSSRTGDDRVWKIPVSGGDAVQVLGKPGYMALESPDGTHLYYVDAVFEPGSLWRMPLSGGAPVKLLDGVVLGNYVPLEKGIYYIDRPSGEKGIHYFDMPAGETRLQYFDLATHRSTTVARNLGNVDTPLSATSDGRTIVFCRTDSSVDDLMLVEKFR